MTTTRRLAWLVALGFSGAVNLNVLDIARAESPDYARDVVPILQKYCAACHGSDEPEGKLSLETHARAMKGGGRGAAIVPGKSAESRLIRMLTGKDKPAMPPKDNDAPSAKEIDVLKTWIDAGARGPVDDKPVTRELVLPKIAPKYRAKPAVTSLAISPDGKMLAVARGREIELIASPDRDQGKTLSGHAGNVQSVAFSTDGKLLVAAAGEAGMAGETRLWDVAEGKLVRTFGGHRDSVLAAKISPDGKLIATGSYDQRIILHDKASGKVVRTLNGHNGAVYDLDFSPDGKLIASASGDRTVKLWDVSTGMRLDTFGQPLKDLYTVAFSPNGRFIAAGGVDRRIRVWEVTAGGKEGTNRLLEAKFAHDGAILRLVWSADGRTLVSSADNQTISVWNAEDLSLRQSLPKQPDWTGAMGLSRDAKLLSVGRSNGSLGTYRIEPGSWLRDAMKEEIYYEESTRPKPSDVKPTETIETEPNDSPDVAVRVVAPVNASGKLQPNAGQKVDADLYRFDSKFGESWIIETNAARSGSQADTKIEVLDANGKPVVRTQLQATRDTAITFRGGDSNQQGYRLANWEEMELNQYLYLGGEVVRLFRFPQGPDSDFLFYESGGKRRNYFDTTAVTHYLDEPGYIVRPVVAGEKLEATGLPVFVMNYVNDDDSLRKLGTDSRLTFTAPKDGAYLVRVTDSRGSGGDKHTYKLSIRRPKPDFNASIADQNPMVGAGSGTRFRVRADLIDGFEKFIRIDITGVPRGWYVTTPILIQREQDDAFGVLYAGTDAKQPTKAELEKIRVMATSIVDGKKVETPAGGFGQIKLGPKPKFSIHLDLDGANQNQASPTRTPVPANAAEYSPAELTVEPGKMVSARLRIERNGFDGEVKFDVNNLPYGVIIDDIGLSGITLLAGQTERQVFIAARPWVGEQERLFHATAQGHGSMASLPMLLKVRSPRK